MILDRDLLPLLQASPFVQPGRERIFARGLGAGLRGDLLSAGHLLVPQLEHSLRSIHREQGVPTTSLDDHGIEQERTLNQLLFLPQMTEVFGEDITFDLQGLLVDEFGANLRNKLAIGLLSHAECYAAAVMYAWWHTLHLCCMSAVTRVSPDTTGTPDDTPTATTQPDD